MVLWFRSLASKLKHKRKWLIMNHILYCTKMKRYNIWNICWYATNIIMCQPEMCIKTIGGGLSKFKRKRKRERWRLHVVNALMIWLNERKRWLYERWKPPDEWHYVDNKKSQKNIKLMKFNFVIEIFFWKMNFAFLIQFSAKKSQLIQNACKLNE